MEVLPTLNKRQHCSASSGREGHDKIETYDDDWFPKPSC